jgi:hypothetical protein
MNGYVATTVEAIARSDAPITMLFKFILDRPLNYMKISIATRLSLKPRSLAFRPTLANGLALDQENPNADKY